MSNELCFLLMPIGRKQDAAGNWIEFDSVYHDLIAPAMRDAGLDAIRAGQEDVGGAIHKPVFERLVLCPYAVADLTEANANAFRSRTGPFREPVDQRRRGFLRTTLATTALSLAPPPSMTRAA